MEMWGEINNRKENVKYTSEMCCLEYMNTLSHFLNIPETFDIIR